MARHPGKTVSIGVMCWFHQHDGSFRTKFTSSIHDGSALIAYAENDNPEELFAAMNQQTSPARRGEEILVGIETPCLNTGGGA